MALIVTNTQQVQITFTVLNDATGEVFTDALYFPVGQVPAVGVLRSLAQDRYQAWRDIVTAPPHVPTLQEKIDFYRARRQMRQALEDELNNEDPDIVAAAG